MPAAGTLHAGAARSVVNPPLGTRQTGFRLFGNPVQAIESDLTATALVLSDGAAKVVVIAIDLSIVGIDLSLRRLRPADEMRRRVADALGIPVAHVLLNTSHAHSGVALPDYMPDTPEQLALKERFRQTLIAGLVDAATAADECLRPARLGCGWGESGIGVYRRETRGGRDVLGEVPDHPIDSSVGVIRVDDLDGDPIAVAFRYSCHPVTMGPRSAVVSSDFPGTARRVVEASVGGLAIFLQGGGGNVSPRAGMGYEDDCRELKERVGLELGGEVVKIAAGIRTATRAGERRPLGNVPNILFTPWEPVEGPMPVTIAAQEQVVELDYVDLPSPEEAEAILAGRRRVLREQREGGHRSGSSASRRKRSTGPSFSSRRHRTSIRPASSSSRPSASATSSSPAWTPSSSSRAASRSVHVRRFVKRSRSATRTERSATCHARPTIRGAAGGSTSATRCPTSSSRCTRIRSRSARIRSGARWTRPSLCTIGSPTDSRRSVARRPAFSGT